MRNFLEKLFRSRATPSTSSTSAVQSALRSKQRAESGLRESEEHFRQLVANVRDYAIFLLDEHGNVRTWNAGAERIKGYKAEEIIGQHFSRFYPRDAVSSGWPAHELSVAEQTGRFEDEGWRVRNDGSRFWANVVITALRGPSGEIRGFLKITRDLTDRKQAEEKVRLSEQRFRLIVEGVKEYAIFMLDPDGNVATWNSGAQRLKGYQASEIVGEHFSRFYPPEAVAQGWPTEELKRAKAGGRFEDEGWRVRKNGSRFWANVVLTPLYDDAGVLQGFAKVTRDLTERKQAEENARKLLLEEAARKAAEEAAQAIQRQREQLRVTLRSIGDGVIVTDTAGNVTFLNPVAAALTGWDAEEAIGHPLERVFQIINEKSRQHVENPVDKVFRERTVVALANNTALIAKDGREVPIEDTAAPIWAEDSGDIHGAVLVFRDVTEARRALQTRLHLAAIVESSDDAILSMNLDGLITSWNGGAERLYGYTAEEAVGRPLSIVVPSEHPDELNVLMERVGQGERIKDFETQRVRKDGTQVDVSLSIAPIADAEGTVIGSSRIARDITERKRVEITLREQHERLRLLWEAAAVLLAADNPDAMLRSVFDKVGPHLGLDAYFNFMLNEKADGLYLASWAGIPNESARGFAQLALGESLSGLVAMRRQPVVATHIQQSDDPRAQAARSFGVRCFAGNPLLAGGELLGTLSFASCSKDEFSSAELEFLQTLTRYVNVAYERLQVIQELQDSDRRKDEFLATLAHELRNPLAPLRSGLQVMHLAGNDATTLERTQRMMERQLDGLVRLVDDLLDVSRISRGKIELRKQPVKLQAVIHSAVETCDPLIRQHGHELTVALPSEPIPLDADPTRLAQVVCNLLNNAAKYTEYGGQIDLAVETSLSEVSIRVRDTGIGIPPDMLPRVFEPFAQGDRTLEKASGGLGVGLTIVKRLVEMHGGNIEAASPGEGRGSEFIVRLPLRPAPAPDPALQRSPHESAPPRDSEASSALQRILVVDDNVDAATSLAMLLQIKGHEVRTAHDGMEAVELGKTFRPSLILMDIGMPKLNGYDACRQIRDEAWGEDVAIVALTGWGQEEDKRRSAQAGFSGHLVKPVQPHELDELLRRLTPQPL